MLEALANSYLYYSWTCAKVHPALALKKRNSHQKEKKAAEHFVKLSKEIKQVKSLCSKGNTGEWHISPFLHPLPLCPTGFSYWYLTVMMHQTWMHCMECDSYQETVTFCISVCSQILPSAKPHELTAEDFQYSLQKHSEQHSHVGTGNCQAQMVHLSHRFSSVPISVPTQVLPSRWIWSQPNALYYICHHRKARKSSEIK